MTEQIKSQKEKSANNIIVFTKQLEQNEAALKLKQKDLDLRKRLLDFELKNSDIVGDKPRYFTEPKYISLVNEHKKLSFEAMEINAKDEIERHKMAINGLKKEIKKLRRNGIPSEENTMVA